MQLLACIFCTFILKTTSAQIAYTQRNAVPGQAITNQQIQAQHLANANANIRATNDGVPRTGHINSLHDAPYFTRHMANAPTHNTPIANLINEQAYAHQDGGLLANADATNIGNIDAATLSNMANINGNSATFNFGNGGFTVTSGSPGSPGFGINVLADALEVGGKVAINGQIPIYGSVAVNGYLPTDGSASVSYACGGPTSGPTVGPMTGQIPAPTVFEIL